MSPNFFVSLLTWAVPTFTPVPPSTAPPTLSNHVHRTPAIRHPRRKKENGEKLLSDENREWLDLQLKTIPVPYAHIKRRWAKHCEVTVWRIERFIKGRRRQAGDVANNVQGGPPIPASVEATDPIPVIVATDAAEDSD